MPITVRSSHFLKRITVAFSSIHECIHELSTVCATRKEVKNLKLYLNP